MNMRFLTLLALTLPMMMLASCGGGGGGGSSSGVITCAGLDDLGYVPPDEPEPDESNSHLEIVNDDSTLDQFFSCQDQLLFDQPGTSQSGVMTQDSKKKGKWKDGFKLKLWAESSPPKIVGKAAAKPGGVLLNDLVSGGTYTGTQESPPYIKYRVEIDGTNPDTFKWSDDNGTTWQETGVTITPGTPQTLSNGVTVTFSADTGHAVGDYWNIHAGILQATSVSMKGNDAVVSYSMVGSPYLGAIRVYRKYHGYPYLRSQALFRDTDINAVSVSGGRIYAVGASEPGVFTYPAILEVIKMKGSRLTLTDNNRLGLPSYAGTSVIHDSHNDKIYATSGNTGGLSIIDDSTFTIDNTESLDDARWVEFERSTDTLVVVQGCCGSATDGNISVYSINSGSPSLQNTFGFTGADIAESKSTVEVVGGKAFVAAGSGGAQVISTVTGNVLATIPIPTAAESGISDPNLRVANAVTVDDDLMFISFGEAGIYVAQADEDFDDSGSEGPVSLTRLGKLKFGDLQSANHVAFKGDYLYVAAGLGGLKIVKIHAHDD
jgi:hypothetical protein